MEPKILVVDDSMTARREVSQTLTDDGFSVVEAANGAEALKMIETTADIRLVICDINMPEMNGLDFLEALRKAEPTATLPVIMLTTEARPNLVERARALGATGWIVKPFKPELLIAAVKKFVP